MFAVGRKPMTKKPAAVDSIQTSIPRPAVASVANVPLVVLFTAAGQIIDSAVASELVTATVTVVPATTVPPEEDKSAAPQS